MFPRILSLAQPWRAGLKHASLNDALSHDRPRKRETRHSPVRGILIGLLIAVPVWLILGLLVRALI
jgi:hypothetical protein